MNIQWRRLIEGIVRRMPWPVLLQTPLGSTAWDGDAHSTVNTNTRIDLHATFGVPRGARAVLLRAAARDSGAWAANLYFTCGPQPSVYPDALSVWPAGGDVITENMGVVPVDPTGSIYYRINASGTNTLDVWLYVWGYWV